MATIKNILARKMLMPMLLVGIVALYFFSMIFGDKGFISDGQFAAYQQKYTPWSGDWATGWPTIADPVGMTLYPIRLVMAELKMPFDFFVVAAYVIAILGMYAYLRCIVEKWAAAFGAITFTISGWMLVHLGHTSMIHASAWLPWMMLGVQFSHGNLVPRKFLSIAILAVAVSMSLMAGHPQITAYSLLLVSLYAIFTAMENKERTAIYFVFAGGLCGIAIAAPVLIPTMEWVNHTPRSEMSKEELFSFAIPFSELPGLIVPLLYGATPHGWFGVDYRIAGHAGETITFLPMIGILFCIVALIDSSVDRRKIFFFLVFGALSILLATGNRFSAVGFITENIFPLNMFRAPSRHMLEVTFCFSALSAIGLQAMAKREFGKYQIRIVAFAMVLLFVSAVSWALASSSELKLNIGNLTWPVIFAVLMATLSLALLYLREEKTGLAVIGGLSIVVLLLQTMMIGYQLPWRIFAHTETIKDQPAWVSDFKNKLGNDYRAMGVNGWQSRVFNPDASRFHGIKTLGWYGPLLNNSVAQLTGLTNGGWIQRFVLSNDDVALDMLSVRYVSISEEEKNLVQNYPERWAFVKSYGNEHVYENMRAITRARLVCKSAIIDNDNLFNVSVRSGKSFLSVADTAYFNDLQTAPTSTESRCDGQIRIIEDTGDVLRIEAKVLSEQAFLVISDLWYPGWTSLVNGRQKEVRRINNTSRGILLEKGPALIEFVYRPSRWGVSILISVFSLSLVIAALLASRGLPLLRRQAG